MAEIQETVGSNLAQLSNAFVKEGIISDDTLDLKDENPKFRQHFGRTQAFLMNLTQATESINQVASAVIETTELAGQVNTSFSTLNKELKDGGDTKKSEETTKKTDSTTSAFITPADLREGDYSNGG